MLETQGDKVHNIMSLSHSLGLIVCKVICPVIPDLSHNIIYGSLCIGYFQITVVVANSVYKGFSRPWHLQEIEQVGQA